MDVTLAKTFTAIAETGSFKDAADRLNVTQSTVSMRVKALEDVLGRRVFERSKLGARLTPARWPSSGSGITHSLRFRSLSITPII